MSIDRIDNDGNYCPENCRIISFADNTVKRFTDRGQGLSVSGVAINIRELIRQSQISPNTIKKLASAGYSTASIVEYGKLLHYQKMAVGLSIKDGDPLSIEDAQKIERKCKVYAKPLGYTNYMGMMGRCYNPRNKAYHRYGGRGIRVCDEWHDFNRFLFDMGAPPHPDAAVHRVDENKDYSPPNCVWFTRSENAQAMHRAKKLLSRQ